MEITGTRRSSRLAAKPCVSYAEEETEETNIYQSLYDILQLSYKNLQLMEQLKAAIAEQELAQPTQQAPLRRSARIAATATSA
jgi:hypothetical protein